MAPPSPKFPDSVFIFGDMISGKFEAVGTCFAISGTLLLTVKHNMDKERTTHYGIALTVERNPISGRISLDDYHDVQICRYSSEWDYAVAEVISGRVPLKPIPTSRRTVEPDTDIKVFHCPVSMFNNDSATLLLSVYTEWAKTARPSAHRIPTNRGFFAGSSGAPFVTRDRFVVGMHVESMNEAVEVNIDGDSLQEAVDKLSDSVNTNANVRNSLSNGLYLGKCTELITDVLPSLNVQVHE
jgi:hypothetical protein